MMCSAAILPLSAEAKKNATDKFYNALADCCRGASADQESVQLHQKCDGQDHRHLEGGKTQALGRSLRDVVLKDFHQQQVSTIPVVAITETSSSS
jgi:hypothetical protein